MSLKRAKHNIQKLNLERIIDKLSSKDTEITHFTKPWSREAAIEGVEQYKRYLWVVRKYQKTHKFLPPSAEIDFIWHAHILDTKAYARDCRLIFGKILHHNPYFGLNGRRERKKLFEAFSKTQELYQREFGEFIYSLDVG
jgi:hypothetical protein